MSNWTDPLIFGATLLAFTLGLSCLIFGFISQPAISNLERVKLKVEYIFFGISGIIASLVLLYAL